MGKALVDKSEKESLGMIKTLQTKLRLGSLKSDCQFHSYQRDGESALHSGKRGGIYEPGVGFD